MALNSYFNNFTNTAEQSVLDDLVVEAVQIYGHAVYYIPRNTGNRDDIWFEDTTSTFSTNYQIEMYISGVDGYGGEQDLLSKFGVEIRDTFEVQVAKTAFDNIVGSPTGKANPQEGDLIYVPMSNDLFEIKFVEDEPVFYQLGSLHLYELKLEKYEYSHETFNTGITALDAWVNTFSLDTENFNLLLEDGTPFVLESGINLILESFDIDTIDPLAQNDVFEEEADAFIDFSETDPFSEGNF